MADNKEQKEQNIENENQAANETDESEKIAQMLKNSETLGSANRSKAAQSDEGADLSDFLDEPSGNDGASALDPELDAALAQFTDNGETAGQKPESENDYDDDEENEENTEEYKKWHEEEKLLKIKRIKRVSLAGSLFVFALAVIIVAAILVNNRATGFVVSYTTEVGGRTQNHRISTNDFKLLLLYTQSWDPVSDALELLMEMLTVEQIANARNLTLTEFELFEIRADAAEIRSILDESFPALDRVSLEFIERVQRMNYLNHRLFDGILEEVGFVLDEEDYAEEFALYFNYFKLDHTDAVFKLMLLSTNEAAAEVKAAIQAATASGEMTIEEAMTAFYYNNDNYAIGRGFESLEELLEEFDFETIEDYLEEYGFDRMDSSELVWFVLPEDISHLISLEVGEISNIIPFQDLYVLFVVESIDKPSEEELEELTREFEVIFRDWYLHNQKEMIFEAELARWVVEFERTAGVTVNQRALDALDLDAIFGF